MRMALYALLAGFFLFTGCCSFLFPSCEAPYIEDGFGCCLDADRDSVCDSSNSGYVCPDGTQVQDMADCPKTLCADGVTEVMDESQCPIGIVCTDGSVVYDASQCPGAELSEAGWYDCNDEAYSDRQPCKDFLAAYCDKFTPVDLGVREAASAAISKHPGAYSINQLLDVYDWMRANIFYQNVPVNFTYQPYLPNETLATKSGDCKNQAMLISSMVEAIGGTARVLLIPNCSHAYTEVYLGDKNNTTDLRNAIKAHYELGPDDPVTWYYHTDADNVTTAWLIYDTAGRSYPGWTIDECFNATHVYMVHDCETYGKFNAPKVAGTEFGPKVQVNETNIVRSDGAYYYHYISNSIGGGYFAWCKYNISVESLSKTFYFDWYVTDEAGYQDYIDGRGFSYYHGEAGVMKGDFMLNWDKNDRFYVITGNPNSGSMTVRTTIVSTCYVS